MNGTKNERNGTLSGMTNGVKELCGVGWLGDEVGWYDSKTEMRSKWK